MGRLYVSLPDNLEDRFRKEVGKRFGAKKGIISKAFKEAVELWLKQS